MVSNKMKYLKNKPWEPIFFKRSYFTVLGVLSFETINILMTVPLSYFFQHGNRQPTLLALCSIDIEDSPFC